MNSNEKPRDYDYDIPEQAEEAWDKLANWYSARKKGSYEFKIQLPAILNLLGNLHGKSLIDIGCVQATIPWNLQKEEPTF